MDLKDGKFYSEEFKKIIREARRNFPSLVAVNEVTGEKYENKDWDFGVYRGLSRLQYEVESDELASEYTKNNNKRNNCVGATAIFVDHDKYLKTGIMIPTYIVGDENVDKYVFRTIALCHELGHVDDIEKEINFKLNINDENRFIKIDLVMSEIYANVYALDYMASRNLIFCCELFLQYFKDTFECDGLNGEIARGVLDELSRRDQNNK